MTPKLMDSPLISADFYNSTCQHLFTPIRKGSEGVLICEISLVEIPHVIHNFTATLTQILSLYTLSVLKLKYFFCLQVYKIILNIILTGNVMVLSFLWTLLIIWTYWPFDIVTSIINYLTSTVNIAPLFSHFIPLWVIFTSKWYS